MAYVNLAHMPSPKQEYVVNFGNLNGGLNLSELEYRLKNTESPDMKNLLWREGVLCSRDGQEWVVDDTSIGTGITMYERPFNGYLVAHIGQGIYAFDIENGLAWEEVIDLDDDYGRGTFFHYYGKLYYKAPGLYVEIEYDPTQEGLKLIGADVSGYVPVIQINTDAATGAGDLYQSENRISSAKTVWFNASSGVAVYHLPVQDVGSVDKVVVDGTEVPADESSTPAAGKYYADLMNGTVTFGTAPPVTTPATNNTVIITYSKDNDDAMASVMDCPYAATYGGTGDLCVVMGGCTAQPNAIFWNTVGYGAAMDPTYFPMDQYQLCGHADDAITGFGKQQSFLVVFKGNSVGRVKQDTTTVDGKLVIDMPYVAINDKIGCDCPNSIQLIENNLVWCNLEQGVHILKDSSYAYENNIECVSRKINGGPTKRGMLDSVRKATQVSSHDDTKRYWLCCDGEVWVWDYENTSYKDPSWYYMTDINAVAFASEFDKTWHLDDAGRLTEFLRNYMDYGGPIEKKYRFASQFFGGYDRLKNVNSVIIAIRPDTNSSAELTYITDYETRKDLTPLSHIAWRLVPRNLTFRSLAGVGFGASFRRRPMCRRVQHFAMQLENNVISEDMSIVSAQIFYNYQGRLR